MKHIHEMNSAVPQNPVIFMKPSTAFLQTGRSFYYPDFSNDIHYEVEVVLKISRQGKHIKKEYIPDFIESVSVGIDFTARDVQAICKENGWPWELAKSFDFSAAVGHFVKIDPERLKDLSFELRRNEETVQASDMSKMIFPIEELIPFISERFTLQKGDLIFTGTPEGVGSIKKGDRFEGFLEKERLLDISIR
jgi:2-keto-4-pentenoate hydratase/2-oxohepta-3-ene-1,7-dioic acid hydratase in catechol pathway